jgi:hypothetical protein
MKIVGIILFSFLICLNCPAENYAEFNIFKDYKNLFWSKVEINQELKKYEYRLNQHALDVLFRIGDFNVVLSEPNNKNSSALDSAIHLRPRIIKNNNKFEIEVEVYNLKTSKLLNIVKANSNTDFIYYDFRMALYEALLGKMYVNKNKEQIRQETDNKNKKINNEENKKKSSIKNSNADNKKNESNKDVNSNENIADKSKESNKSNSNAGNTNDDKKTNKSKNEFNDDEAKKNEDKNKPENEKKKGKNNDNKSDVKENSHISNPKNENKKDENLKNESKNDPEDKKLKNKDLKNKKDNLKNKNKNDINSKNSLENDQKNDASKDRTKKENKDENQLKNKEKFDNKNNLKGKNRKETGSESGKNQKNNNANKTSKGKSLKEQKDIRENKKQLEENQNKDIALEIQEHKTETIDLTVYQKVTGMLMGFSSRAYRAETDGILDINTNLAFSGINFEYFSILSSHKNHFRFLLNVDKSFPVKKDDYDIDQPWEIYVDFQKLRLLKQFYVGLTLGYENHYFVILKDFNEGYVMNKNDIIWGGGSFGFEGILFKRRYDIGIRLLKSLIVDSNELSKSAILELSGSKSLVRLQTQVIGNYYIEFLSALIKLETIHLGEELTGTIKSTQINLKYAF